VNEIIHQLLAFFLRKRVPIHTSSRAEFTHLGFAIGGHVLKEIIIGDQYPKRLLSSFGLESF